MIVGNDETPFHDAVGIGKAIGRNAEFLVAKHRLASDVASPDHSGVDSVGFHPLLKIGAADARIRLDDEREHMPPGFDSFSELGEYEEVWVLRKM